MTRFNAGESSGFYIEVAGISQLAAWFLSEMDKNEASNAISKLKDINVFVGLLQDVSPRKCKKQEHNYFGFDCAINLVQKHRQIGQSELDAQEVTFFVEDIAAVVFRECSKWDLDKWMSLRMATITRLSGVKNEEVHKYAEAQAQVSSDDFTIQLVLNEAKTLKSIEETQARVKKDLGIE
jgi:hypothetical protein